MRRRWIVLVVAGVTGVSLLVGVGQVRREREWAHGGDALTITAEVRLAEAGGFRSAASALGVADPVALPDRYRQAVVVRLSWRAPVRHAGTYQVLALDARLAPPRPLRTYGGWVAGAGTGAGWSSSYEVLARRYAWLRRTATVSQWPRTADGVEMGSVGVRATRSGSVTVIFMLGQGELLLTDPGTEVLVAVFHVDDGGEVRWARRVPLAG